MNITFSLTPIGRTYNVEVSISSVSVVPLNIQH